MQKYLNLKYILIEIKIKNQVPWIYDTYMRAYKNLRTAAKLRLYCVCFSMQAVALE